MTSVYARNLPRSAYKDLYLTDFCPGDYLTVSFGYTHFHITLSYRSVPYEFMIEDLRTAHSRFSLQLGRFGFQFASRERRLSHSRFISEIASRLVQTTLSWNGYKTLVWYRTVRGGLRLESHGAVYLGDIIPGRPAPVRIDTSRSPRRLIVGAGLPDLRG
jgi:hypothetical protein